MSGVVISHHFATLFELESIYSYEDLMTLYEIIIVNNNNEQKAYEAVKKSGHSR